MSSSAPTKKVFQSPSRNKTYKECSQRYAASYIWKLPDTGNDGSNRGNVCHDTLELLLKPKHAKLYGRAVNRGTCTEVPSLWRLIRRYARKYGVDDDANLKMIDKFMLVALTNEFHGPAGTIETVGEREFRLEINHPDGRRYNVRGFVDQTFIVKDELGLLVSITDFKTQKSPFSPEELQDNVQSIVYQLAAKYDYPHISRRRFRFLMLKFPKDPWQEPPALSDDQLYGYEWVLTDMQKRLESFTLANASDNLAYHNPENSWLCGKEGTKKDGTPMFICPARMPMDYWVLMDADGNTLSSARTEGELKPKEGQVVVSRRYPGCPAFWDPQTGKRRSFGA